MICSYNKLELDIQENCANANFMQAFSQTTDAVSKNACLLV